MNQVNIPSRLRLLNSNEEVINELLEIIKEEKLSKVALLTSKTPNHLITNYIETALFSSLEKLKTFQVVSASISAANQLPLENFDLIIGIGGGKVIDMAKYVAFLNHIPCISIPTTISNDGICSPISVLQEKQNKYKSVGAKIPHALLVPIHLVKKSDSEYLISGIGDLLSNLTAIEDWKLANKEKGEHLDDYAVIVSENAAKEVLYLIEKYILLGKPKEQFLNDNIKSIINGLALSGVAMEIAGTSRPASGAEHLLSHSIDELFGGKKQHGIQVAFGMYVISFIKYKKELLSKDEFGELRAVLRYLGLPTTLYGIGLTKDELAEAIMHAPNTRSDRYTILNKLKLKKDEIDKLLDGLFGQNIISSEEPATQH